MSAFNSLNGVPASANPFTLTQVLRKEWGFQGIVVSDYSSIGELVAHGVAADDATAARKAFLAGVDMDMTSSLYHDQLAQLVRSGVVPEANIDESVRRVLRVKLALGLFEHPYVDEGRAQHAFFLPESLQLAQTVAERSFVLLKNAPAAGGKPLLPISNQSEDGGGHRPARGQSVGSRRQVHCTQERCLVLSGGVSPALRGKQRNPLQGRWDSAGQRPGDRGGGLHCQACGSGDSDTR